MQTQLDEVTPKIVPHTLSHISRKRLLKWGPAAKGQPVESPDTDATGASSCQGPKLSSDLFPTDLVFRP